MRSSQGRHTGAAPWDFPALRPPRPAAGDPGHAVVSPHQYRPCRDGSPRDSGLQEVEPAGESPTRIRSAIPPNAFPRLHIQTPHDSPSGVEGQDLRTLHL